MAHESSKSSTKSGAAVKAGASAKSTARLSSTQDTKPGMPAMSNSEVAFQECEAVEAELAALKVVYEHYFLGLERKPPAREHDALKKRVDKLKSSFVRNTAAKFRVQAMHNKFLSYERMWMRTLQEIENGTFKRDRVKAKKRLQQPSSADKSRASGPIELPEEDIPTDFDLDEVTVTDLRPLSPPIAAAPPVAASGPTPFRGAPAVPAVPAVAPRVPTAPSMPAVPAVAPRVPTVPSMPAVPAVPAVAPRVSTTPSMPAVAPRVPTAPSMPAVAPVGTTPGRGVPTAPSRPPPAARPPPAPEAHAAANRPAGAPALRAPVASSSEGGISDEKLRAVYDAYISAKRRNKEDTSKMSFDAVAASLRKQVPELMKQHNARSVEFKVILKDGKALLKAVPK
jgi:hypothetical protein